ncbi:hypothetical protein [Massilia sp. DWR3-1-1]|uniref:hypothetical protein n=1 Tax=Massilia sp. DWR3-1-1 TaxID=2804559 RepID=UPI003CF6E9AC
MNSKIAADERANFSKRLCIALLRAECSVSPTVFAQEFNLRTDGFAITSHAARKWLRGEAFPTQDKLVVLSRWLALSPQWLRYGEECATESDYAANDPMGLPRDHLALLHDMQLLDDRSREIVKDLVASLMRISQGGRKRTPRN